MRAAAALPLETRPAASVRVAPRVWLVRSGEASLGVVLALLWAYSNAFCGVDGDARIYIGRALADLDPNGVGRDLMFANDGQSSFSIYRYAVAMFAGHVGFAAAVPILSILNLTVWFAAAATLAATFARGRVLAVVLAALCVLPRTYAPWHFIGAGEIIAVPRPLAEACVLFALAAMMRERWTIAVISLLVGALLHPIMTLPGAATLYVMAATRDRRWLVAALVGAMAVALAALAGVPVLSRLLVRIDPLWRGVLLERNPYLFPHLWPFGAFALQSVQATTIVVGSSCLPPTARRLLRTALAIGIAGCLLALACGDGLSSLLVVQAQLWRAMWLPAVLAPMAAGLCLCFLSKRGPSGHVTLAALCAAWLSLNQPFVAVAAAAVALALHVAPRKQQEALGRPSVIAAWLAAGLLGALALSSSLRALAIVFAGMTKQDAGFVWPLVWGMNVLAAPVLLALWALWRWPATASARVGLPIAAMLGLGVLPFVWDVRTPARRDLDAAHRQDALVSQLDQRPGPILWLGSDDVWWWARRANWDGLTQGGALVFSRDLAMLWRARTQAMLEHGLASRDILDPWRNAAPLAPRTLDPTEVADFCRRPGAPAWIVDPLEPGTVPAAVLHAAIWDAPVRDLQLKVGGDGVRWLRQSRFALVPCAS